jgi:hypothetical protein
MKQWHYVFVHNLDPCITVRRKSYDFSFFDLPATNAFFNENILLFNKYNKKIYFENYLFNYYNSQLVFYLIRNKLKGYRYFYHNYYYKIFKSFRFESDFYTIGQRKTIFRLSLRPWEWKSHQFIHGYNLKWDVPMELYKGDFRKVYWWENVISTKRVL